MAWLFELCAECGAERNHAEAFGRHFEGLEWTLSDGLQIRTSGAYLNFGDDGNIWASVTPEGVSRTGGANAAELRQMREAGWRLYDRLRTAPPLYRFATVGVECTTFNTVDAFPDLIALGRLSGLVLCEILWEEFGRPKQFTHFSTGYYWWPYEGEIR
jgi:hypothetical protein